MPIIYVRDKSDRRIYALEEKWSSLVWTERYQEAGDFVLEIPLNAANVDRYKPGNFLTLDDSKESMVIESRTIDDTIDEPLLKVSGRSLSSLLSKRINASKVTELQNPQSNDMAMVPTLLNDAENSTYSGVITYSGSASEVLQSLFDDEVLNPITREWAFFHRADGEMFGTEGGDGTLVEGFLEPFIKAHWPLYNKILPAVRNAPNRKMYHIVFVNSVPENVEINSTFSEIMTVYDLLVKISKQNYIGFRSYFNSNDDIVIETYKGTNRSSGQNTLTPVIFNPIMENVTRLNYFEDYSQYKSTGFVYSDAYINCYPKAEVPFILSGFHWVKSSVSGDERYCVGLDARSEVSFSSLRSNPDLEIMEGSDQEGDVSGDIDHKEEWLAYYEAVNDKLMNTGIAMFDDGDYNVIRTSEGEVDPLVRYKFEEDYYIGDVVEISDERGNIAMSAYIDEAIRSYDNNEGIIITPNFKNVLDYDDGREDS